jgi:hypothetical protein
MDNFNDTDEDISKENDEYSNGDDSISDDISISPPLSFLSSITSLSFSIQLSSTSSSLQLQSLLLYQIINKYLLSLFKSPFILSIKIWKIRKKSISSQIYSWRIFILLG